MITDAEVERIPGAAVYGSDGEKIGKAGAVYRDDQTGRPEWVTVQTGLFGTSESFVPLAQAELDGDDLRVPYDKSKVKDAPRVDDEGHLDISEEDRLFEHYGVTSSGAAGSAGHDARDARDERDLRHDDRRDDDRGVAAKAGDRLDHDRGDDRRDGYRDDVRDDVRDGFRDDRHDDRDDDRGRGVGTAAAAGGAGLGGLAAAAAAHREDRRDDRDDRDDREGRGGRVSRMTGTDTGTARDDRFADGEDIGRRGDRSDSGLGSAPVATGTAGGHAAGSSGERRPRLSQWVMVKREDIIEVPADEAERLARQQDGGTLR